MLIALKILKKPKRALLQYYSTHRTRRKCRNKLKIYSTSNLIFFFTRVTNIFYIMSSLLRQICQNRTLYNKKKLNQHFCAIIQLFSNILVHIIERTASDGNFNLKVAEKLSNLGFDHSFRHKGIQVKLGISRSQTLQMFLSDPMHSQKCQTVTNAHCTKLVNLKIKSFNILAVLRRSM